MKWYASVEPCGPGDAPPTLIIEAAMAYDAAQYAARMLGRDGLIFQQTGDDAVADVELRFVGDDYNSGGTPDARRMQIRKRAGKTWGKWEEMK